MGFRPEITQQGMRARTHTHTHTQSCSHTEAFVSTPKYCTNSKVTHEAKPCRFLIPAHQGFKLHIEEMTY